MKKIIILSMLMLLGVGVRAADYGYLVFTLSDGTTKSITSTGVNITFADGKLTATAGTETVAVELASLTKMEFSNDGTTGISSVNCDFEAAEGTGAECPVAAICSAEYISSRATVKPLKCK